MDQCFFFQFIGFDDYFQQYVSCCIGFFIGFYQFEIDLFVVGDQCVVWEDYVYFICFVSDCCVGFCQCNVDIVIFVWEVGDCGDVNIWCFLFIQCFMGDWDEVWVDVDCCGVIYWCFCLMIQGNDFFIGVVVIQSGQVYQF